MTRTDLSGWLLLGSFALWFPAATLPALYHLEPAVMGAALLLD